MGSRNEVCEMASWLVTGGCGFIGSHLVEALIGRGDRVRVLDDLSSGRRENLPAGAELLVGDVAEPAMAATAADGMDGIFHLAAVASVERCRQDWLGSHRTNLTGTIALFEAARRRRSPLPVVYASSAAVYGDSDRLPLRESDCPHPLSAYGSDKLGCELHGRVAWSAYGVANSGLRFFNVFGPRQDPASPYSGVIAIFAGRLARRLPIEIFGDGRQTRDFIFVGDAVGHLLAAMERLGSGAQVFNVCTGRATSILELAQTMARISGEAPVILERPKRVGDIDASVGDPSAARRGLGVSAAVSLAEGLRRTLTDRAGLHPA
jgi:UDP-glucose 4-epimerase